MVLRDGRKQAQREAFHWSIVAIRESECPTSAIMQRSIDLVQIVNAMQDAKESTGSTLGTDEMPGCLLDAVRVCRRESEVSEAAMDEAANQ